VIMLVGKHSLIPVVSGKECKFWDVVTTGLQGQGNHPASAK